VIELGWIPCFGEFVVDYYEVVIVLDDEPFRVVLWMLNI